MFFTITYIKVTNSSMFLPLQGHHQRVYIYIYSKYLCLKQYLNIVRFYTQICDVYIQSLMVTLYGGEHAEFVTLK